MALKVVLFASVFLAVGLRTSPLNAQTSPMSDSSIVGRAGYANTAPLDTSTAGYYRLVIRADNLDETTLCPSDSEQRSEWVKTAGNVWAWAIKQKQEWSAGIQLSYGNILATAFSADGYKSDLSKKFVTVRQEGKDLNKCKVFSKDLTYTRSPLLPFRNEASSYVTVQFIWWYNKSADGKNIQDIFSYGMVPLELIGVPSALSQKIASVGSAGLTKYISQSGAPIEAVLNINPLLVGQNGAVVYLAPNDTKRNANPAKAIISMETVGSMFIDGPVYKSLAGLKADKVVQFPIKGTDNIERPLSAYVATLTSSLTAMQNSNNTDKISANCEIIDKEIQDKLKFSPVDSAVFLFYVVKGMGDLNSKLVDPFKITCIKDRADLLKLVAIEQPIIAADDISNSASASTSPVSPPPIQ